MIEMKELQSEDQLDKPTIMKHTSDTSRAPFNPENRWDFLLICLLNELKQKK